MHFLLIAATAALVVSGAPALAQSGSTGLGASHGVRTHRLSVDHQFRGNRGNRDERIVWGDQGRRQRDFADDAVVGNYGSYGDWGRYNNRSFDPDGFNDWWHERPWRSYPRWVSNGTCDRMWWGGGTWRCSW
jgi:hypothetical protein